MEEEEGKKKKNCMRKEEEEKNTRERSKLYDKSCHSSGGGLICACQLRLEKQAVRLAGRLLPFIGRQINRGPPGARRATISV